MPDKSVAYGLHSANEIIKWMRIITINYMAIIFDLSLYMLYGLVRRPKTSPAFRLVNDKSIDDAV